MIKRRRRRERRTSTRCVTQANSPTEMIYYVDVDFTKGDNETLSVVDQMGRATVTLENYTGEENSGFDASGLVSRTGATKVHISQLNLDAIREPIEIGVEVTDVDWQRVMRGVYMLGLRDSTTLFEAYTCYQTPAKSITLEYSTSNRGQLYASTSMMLNQPLRLSLLFDRAHVCTGAWIDKGDGTMETARVLDNSGNTIDIRTITQPLTGLTEILLFNRISGGRPFRGTLQRFFIRSYIPEKGGGNG